ncbi:MAG: biopolymer transport protein ExbB/TolQ [Myxococcota bacterium]|jgi:biopolymer transport protein ExbB/TolQ
MIESLMNAMNFAGSEWVLWLLFGLSVASVGVMIERTLFLWQRRIDIDSVTDRVSRLVAGGRADEASKTLEASPSMEARVGLRVLQNLGMPPEGIEDLYKSSIERERMRYEQRIGFLATLGSNAPFVGLFGTVLGIIAAFADLQAAAAGANRSQVIMGSISEALVATAAGLLVAIPAVAAYNVLQRRIERSVGGTEVLVRELLAQTRRAH